jgi:hypothetical protein
MKSIPMYIHHDLPLQSFPFQVPESAFYPGSANDRPPIISPAHAYRTSWRADLFVARPLLLSPALSKMDFKIGRAAVFERDRKANDKIVGLVVA